MPIPHIWCVPHQRNPFFTGQEDILTQIHQSLEVHEAGAIPPPLGISGLGGLGKTQVVLEYAYRYRSEYQAVLWVRADTSTNLIDDFVELADVLKLPERHEQDHMKRVHAVLSWLHNNAGWLLIYDNIDDLSLAEPFLPKGPGHLLFTTRAYALEGLAQRLDLDKMDPETGALLLLRKANLLDVSAALDMANPGDRSYACAISQELDGLPLALDQAGAFICEAPCQLSEYLALYRTRRDELLGTRGSLAQDYPESVATTWSLAFGKVREADTAAAELLRFSSYLAPDAIPESLIHGAVATFQNPWANSPLRKIANDQLSFDGSMKMLLRYSLIARQKDKGTFSIHRLVQTVIRDAATDFEKIDMISSQVIPALRDTFPDPEDTDQWKNCAQYIPHVLEGMQWILQNELFFESIGELLYKAGIYLQKQARYREAEQCYTLSLRIFQDCGEDIGVAVILNMLGMLYQSQRYYQHADNSYQQALKILESQSEDVSLIISAIKGNRAELYRDQGNFKQALNSYLENPQTQQGLLAGENLESATAFNNLALLYTNQNKYEEAEPLLLKALAIRQRLLGNEDPEVANSLNNLGALYRLMGRYTDAEQNFQQALTIMEHHYATDHPAIATTLNNFGELYRVQGRYDLAEDYLVRALTIREKQQENPIRAQSLISLGALYIEQGRYAKSETVLRQALELQKLYLGNDHPDLATTLNNLGTCCMHQRNFAEAEEYFTQALAMREQLADEKLALSLNNLATLYQMQEKYVEAERLYQQAIEIQEQFLGSRKLELARTLTNLGELYRLEKKHKKAEQAFIRALNIYQEPEQTIHRDMAHVVNNLGLIADERKMYDIAEQFYLSSIAITEHLLGANHPDLVIPLYNQAYLYHRLGMRKQAEPVYQRALEICEEHLGTEHSFTLEVRERYASLLTQKPLESRKPGIWPRFFRRNSS
jgi:tetratricopeptide (TPR) repeat protein